MKTASLPKDVKTKPAKGEKPSKDQPFVLVDYIPGKKELLESEQYINYATHLGMTSNLISNFNRTTKKMNGLIASWLVVGEPDYILSVVFMNWRMCPHNGKIITMEVLEGFEFIFVLLGQNALLWHACI